MKSKALPQNKVTMVQTVARPTTFSPDAEHNQLYIGGPKQYQAYRRRRLEEKLTTEELGAAAIAWQKKQCALLPTRRRFSGVPVWAVQRRAASNPAHGPETPVESTLRKILFNRCPKAMRRESPKATCRSYSQRRPLFPNPEIRLPRVPKKPPRAKAIRI